jgi:hypothetical protein
MPGLVYVVGGSSSVGKTTAATTLAGRLGATHLQVDALARASQDPRVSLPADADGIWTLPATQICALLIQKGEALADQLDATIAELAARWPVSVLEGEGIHPSLAGHHRLDRARFAFVVEPDQAVLFATLAQRSARFRALPAAQQRTVAATNRLYGTWLQQQAQQWDQPCIQARPWATLPDRLIQAWHQTAPFPEGS